MNTGPYSDGKVQKFIQEEFIPARIQVFWDKPTEEMRKFGITWTPTFVVLDEEGQEHHRFVGYVPADDLMANLGLSRGKIFFDTGRMAEAILRFKTVVERHPDAGAAPEAVFLLGVAGYKHTHDAKELRRVYEKLKADYPQSEWARKAEPYSSIPL